jgi:hypothetical protein
MIVPGSLWESDILAALESAKVAVLLISQAFSLLTSLIL